MKSAEIKDMSTQDLQERIAAEKAKLSTLKIQHAVSPVENPSTIKKSGASMVCFWSGIIS